MKKAFILTLILSLSVTLVGCKKDHEPTLYVPDIGDKQRLMATGEYIIDPEQSEIRWESKRTVDNKLFYGTVKLENGKLNLSDGIVESGELAVKMDTLEVQSLEGSSKNQLADHLKSEDFFEVETYEMSTFTFKAVESMDDSGTSYMVTGDLQIKDVTKEIAFPASIYEVDGQLVGETQFDIDRTEWNVIYGSGKFFKNLGDRAISDIITYKIKLLGETTAN